jgi:hypothetical protein
MSEWDDYKTGSDTYDLSKRSPRSPSPMTGLLRVINMSENPLYTLGTGRLNKLKCRVCAQDVDGPARVMQCGHAFHPQCIESLIECPGHKQLFSFTPVTSNDDIVTAVVARQRPPKRAREPEPLVAFEGSLKASSPPIQVPKQAPALGTIQGADSKRPRQGLASIDALVPVLAMAFQDVGPAEAFAAPVPGLVALVQSPRPSPYDERVDWKNVKRLIES